jgi:hypothetical protein
MNYIKPEDIKEYVSKNPTGIAGTSKELSEMVNYFVEQIVIECARKADQIENYVKTDNSCGDYLKKHFGVEEQTISQKMADAGYTRRPRGWTKEDSE